MKHYNDQYFNGNQLKEVATPTESTDAANKGYVDNAIVQSDWNQTNTSAKDYIKNKPTIPTLRTMNGEQLTDSTLGDINIHDGFYFPNAVQDYDGNWYGAVVIGNKVWMAENLKTTHMPNGTAITKGTSSSSPRYCYPDNQESNVAEYGLLYNWYAVMNGASASSANPSGVQGIAPVGWHIPSASETYSFDHGYVENQKRFIADNVNGETAKSLAFQSGWKTSSNARAVGNNQSLNNKTGFSAKPAGYHLFGSSGSGYNNFQETALFATTQVSGSDFIYFGISYNYGFCSQSPLSKTAQVSVRCVSDLTPVQFRNWYIEQYGSLQHIVAEDVQEQADWNQTDTTAVDYIKNKPTIPAAQVQSDWEQTDTGSADYIKNKPVIVEELNDLSDVDITPDVSQQTYFEDVVEDYDGNKYDVVIVGNQVWMAENYRLTHYNDGTAIDGGEIDPYSTNGYRAYPNGNSNNVNDYGLLYTYYAYTDENFSPNGWHVPSRNEWNILANTLQVTYGYPYVKQMASTYGWASSSLTGSPGENQNTNNTSLFNLPPAGNTTSNTFGNIGSFATTGTENNAQHPITLTYNSVDIDYSQLAKWHAVSVRFICDLTADEFRAQMSLKGKVLMHDGSKWTDGEIPAQQQADWSQSDNTKDDYIKNKPVIVEELNDLSDVDIVTDVSQQTYFEDAVEDYDGNKYDAVIIGDQVWMAENLKTTHYADGTPIIDNIIRHYTYPNNDQTKVETYGLLYDWHAVIKETDTNPNEGSSLNPSGIQGIAPNGWHIPSDAEWTQLTSYVGNQDQYILNNNNTYIAKALASTSEWDTSTIAYTIGNNQTLNNATGFNIFPAGVYNHTATPYAGFGNEAWFWSATRNQNNQASYRFFDSDLASVFSEYQTIEFMCSVRCVCDLSPSEFRAKMALKNKVLMNNGDKWVAGDIPAQQQADWSQMNTSAPDYIKNKPTIPDNVFVCTYNNNGMDKTPQEIYTAYSAGKLIIAQLGQSTYVCTLASSNTGIIEFTNIANPTDNNNICASYIRYYNNNWSVGSKYLQVRLTSGTNIKTINGESLLGNGNIDVQDALVCTFTGTDNLTCDKTVAEMFEAYQNKKIVVGLISTDYYYLQYVNEVGYATFFKIRNYNGVTIDMLLTTDDGSSWVKTNSAVQEKLVSGTTIKTINNQIILGSGDIDTKEIVWCTYTETDSTNRTGTMSMTTSEISSALNSRKIVALKYGQYCYFADSNIQFSSWFSGYHFTLQYMGDDVWKRIDIESQPKLVSGTNIKTINGQSLLGSGALNMPGTLFYAYTDTPESTADKVVTLISPTTGFTNGSHLLLHFYSAVPAGNANTITIGNDQYMLAYHQSAITTAGIINAGDKALVVCYNSVAHVIVVDRWGVDISNILPSYTNNAGKLLAVNNEETGVEWKDLSTYKYIKALTVTSSGSRNVDLATLYDGVTYTESCIEINSDADASITVNALSLYKNTFVVMNTTGSTTVNFLFNMRSLSYGTLNCSSDYVNSFYEISVPVLPTGARVVEICKIGTVINITVSGIHMDTILTPDDFIIVQNALQDYDGNYYDGLMVNGRLWMASNLRTKHYADGTSIPLFSTGMTMDPYYAYPSNNPNPTDEFFKNYGLYYNWNAAMKYPAGHTNATTDGTTANPSNWQGIAPNGWHIPSLAEWSDFFAYIANKQEYNLSYDTNKSAFGSHIAKAVCSKTGWASHTNTDAVGNNQALNNATGFNIFPVGYWLPTDSTSRNVGNYTYFWSTAPHASTADNAWYVCTIYYYAYMSQVANSRFYGFSVRCVRND